MAICTEVVKSYLCRFFHTHTHTHMHAHMDTHTHTHMHARMDTHTHTHDASQQLLYLIKNGQCLVILDNFYVHFLGHLGQSYLSRHRVALLKHHPFACYGQPKVI